MEAQGGAGLREDSVLQWMDMWGWGSLGELALGLGDRSGATNIRDSNGI